MTYDVFGGTLNLAQSISQPMSSQYCGSAPSSVVSGRLWSSRFSFV